MTARVFRRITEQVRKNTGFVEYDEAVIRNWSPQEVRHQLGRVEGKRMVDARWAFIIAFAGVVVALVGIAASQPAIGLFASFILIIGGSGYGLASDSWGSNARGKLLKWPASRTH